MSQDQKNNEKKSEFNWWLLTTPQKTHLNILSLLCDSSIQPLETSYFYVLLLPHFNSHFTLWNPSNFLCLFCFFHIFNSLWCKIKSHISMERRSGLSRNPLMFPQFQERCIYMFFLLFLSFFMSTPSSCPVQQSLYTLNLKHFLLSVTFFNIFFCNFCNMHSCISLERSSR